MYQMVLEAFTNTFLFHLITDKAICSDLPDRRPNTENVEFGCSVNIIGGVNPRFTVSRENEIVEQITPAMYVFHQ